MPNCCTDGGCDWQSLDSGFIGLAISNDGVNWRRGLKEVSLKGDRSAFEPGTDVGTVLTPNTDDWCVMFVSHHQLG